jgi:hypothetical protein
MSHSAIRRRIGMQAKSRAPLCTLSAEMPELSRYTLARLTGRSGTEIPMRRALCIRLESIRQRRSWRRRIERVPQRSAIALVHAGVIRPACRRESCSLAAVSPGSRCSSP